VPLPRPFGVRRPPQGDPDRVRLEVDLPHERLVPSAVPVVREFESLLREQEIEEAGSLVLRTAELLDELAGLGFRRVDHWEADPEGWLPLPEASHRGRTEPTTHLLNALRSPSWGFLAQSKAFSVRLSSEDGRRVDAVVLHYHRERQHSITLDLWGPPSKAELREVIDRLRRRFSPLKMRLGS
jgi:hypothetical protein